MPSAAASRICVRWKSFFHVTHEFNVPSILRYGLDPTLATGLAKRTWLCDLSKLPWAIKHVCTHQGWQIGETMAIRVCLPRDLPVRHREGIYYVVSRTPPKYLGASIRFSIQE